jgi:glycerol-3-phosphate acyltransferase PlsY
VGVATAFWPPALLILLPIGAGLLYGLGYASVATMSVGLVTIVVFSLRAWLGYGPWAYAAFGLVVWLLVLWGLRPNIKRLVAGQERIIGWRARRKQRMGSEQGGEA